MPHEYSFHLNFFTSTKPHGDAFEGIMTSVKLKQQIHTQLFSISTFIHYALKTKQVGSHSNASGLHSILSQGNSWGCLFLSSVPHGKCHSCLQSPSQFVSH
jgi:hypothetical protein